MVVVERLRTHSHDYSVGDSHRQHNYEYPQFIDHGKGALRINATLCFYVVVCCVRECARSSSCVFVDECCQCARRNMRQYMHVVRRLNV